MKQATLYLERQLRVYKHTWRGSVFSTFLTPILMLAALGIGLGSLVDEQIEGYDYLVWLGPGLLAVTGMTEGAGQGAYPVFAGLKWVKYYDALLSTPMRVVDLVRGHVLWVLLRTFAALAVYALGLVVFDAASPLDAAAAIAPGLLLSLAFAGPTMAYTATVESDSSLSFIFRYVTTPLFLFSGTFFPIEQLPDNIEPLAALSPAWHAVELARAASLGIEPGLHPLIHIGVLAALAYGGFRLARRNLERRLVA